MVRGLRTEYAGAYLVWVEVKGWVGGELCGNRVSFRVMGSGYALPVKAH